MHLPVARWVALNTVCRYPGRELSKEMACEAMRGIRRSSSYEAIQRDLRAQGFHRAGEISPSIPVITAFGDQDVLLPKKTQNRQFTPDHGDWLTMDRCGHLPMWDQPEAVIELSQKLVGSLS